MVLSGCGLEVSVTCSTAVIVYRFNKLVIEFCQRHQQLFMLSCMEWSDFRRHFIDLHHKKISFLSQQALPLPVQVIFSGHAVISDWLLLNLPN